MNSDLAREANSPRSGSGILGTGRTPSSSPEGPVVARQVDRLVVLPERVARGRPRGGELSRVRRPRRPSPKRPQRALDRRGSIRSGRWTSRSA